MSANDPAAIGQQQVRETRVIEAHQTVTARGKVTVIVRADQLLTKPANSSSQAIETRTAQQISCDLVRGAISDEERDRGWRVVGFRLLFEKVISTNESEVQ